MRCQTSGIHKCVLVRKTVCKQKYLFVYKKASTSKSSKTCCLPRALSQRTEEHKNSNCTETVSFVVMKQGEVFSAQFYKVNKRM